MITSGTRPVTFLIARVLRQSGQNGRQQARELGSGAANPDQACGRLNYTRLQAGGIVEPDSRAEPGRD